MHLSRARSCFFGSIVLTLALARPGALAANEDNRPPEFKVLDRWIGQWDLDVTVKPGQVNPQGSHSTFRQNVSWTLNNRFMRCDAEGQGESGERKFKDAFTWIATYDPQQMTYTSSVFWSNVSEPGGPSVWGGGAQGTGKWDEQAKTFTVTTVQGNIETVSVTKWTDDDHHEFTSTITDHDAKKVVLEMTGKARRVPTAKRG